MDLSDRNLAMALAHVQDLEQATRAAMDTQNLAERDRAVHAMRLATALGRSLETWIALRAMRAAMTASSV